MFDVVDLSQIPSGALPIKMCHSDATAMHLFRIKDGLYASLIRFPPKGAVPKHTHEGGHILYVRSGSGTLTKAMRTVPLTMGVVYLVLPKEAHAISADVNGLDLLVFGDTYLPEGSEERLELVT